jgi:O-antigen ligase/polysaccharide polymerase Wzy-like membrane protein
VQADAPGRGLSRDASEARSLGRGALWLGLLALVLPFHDGLVQTWNQFRPWPDLVAAALAVALLTVLVRTSADLRRRARFWAPLVLLGCISIASVVTNQVPLETAARGLRAIPLVLAGLAAACLCEPEDVERFAGTMVIAGGVLAAYGIMSFLALYGFGGPLYLSDGPRSFWETLVLYPYLPSEYTAPYGWRLRSTFLNENYFGIWMAMLAPVALALSLNEQRRARRWAWLGLTGLLLAACVWTYSRAAALALLVAVLAFAWRSTPRAALLIIPLVLAALAFMQPQDIRRFTDLPATEGGRLHSVHEAMAALRSHPLLGRGPGTAGLTDMQYARIAFETGLLGLASFGWLLLCAFSPAFGKRLAGAREQRLSSALLAALLAMTAAAAGGEVWENPQLGYYFWIMAGLLPVLRKQVPDQPLPESSPPPDRDRARSCLR